MEVNMDEASTVQLYVPGWRFACTTTITYLSSVPTSWSSMTSRSRVIVIGDMDACTNYSP